MKQLNFIYPFVVAPFLRSHNVGSEMVNGKLIMCEKRIKYHKTSRGNERDGCGGTELGQKVIKNSGRKACNERERDFGVMFGGLCGAIWGSMKYN